MHRLQRGQGCFWLLLLLFTHGRVDAGAGVLLTDGQVLEGTDVRREGDIVLLTLSTGTILTLPSSLVAEIRLTDEGKHDVAPTGMRVAEPRTLVGPDARPPTTAESLEALGGPAKFQSSPTDPNWQRKDPWEGKSAENWNPSTWQSSPTDPSWAPKSAFDGTRDVMSNSASTWAKSPTNPNWTPTDGFKKQPTAFTTTAGPARGTPASWTEPVRQPGGETPTWSPPRIDPAMCGEQIAKAQLGLEAAPAPRSPVQVKAVDDDRFTALPIALYELETERSGAVARGVFTVTGGDCRLIAGDLSVFLGVPMSSAHAASQAATAYNLALEYGRTVRLTEQKELLEYAYRVVALATPEVSGRQHAELRLLAKTGEIQKLSAEKGPACKLGRSRRKKELRKATEAFSEPKIVQTSGGSVLKFFTWLSAGGHVVRQEVFVGGDGHISLQSETVATHLGAHRD